MNEVLVLLVDTSNSKFWLPFGDFSDVAFLG